jgi:hypothetical protein
LNELPENVLKAITNLMRMFPDGTKVIITQEDGTPISMFERKK